MTKDELNQHLPALKKMMRGKQGTFAKQHGVDASRVSRVLNARIFDLDMIAALLDFTQAEKQKEQQRMAALAEKIQQAETETNAVAI